MNDQVDALLSDFRNARVSQGRSVVELPAEQMDGSHIDLRIELGSGFPSQSPTVKLTTPNMQHEWLDSSQRIIGCPSLQNWNSGNSTLRKTMIEIVEEFFLNPPTRSQQPVQPVMPPAGLPRRSPASLHAVMAELQELPPSELDKLSKDDTDVGLQKFLQKHPTFLEKQKERSKLEQQNEALARTSLAQQSVLVSDQKEHQEVYSNYHKLHQAVTAKSQAQHARLEEFSPQAVQGVLTSLISQSDSTSDSTITQFQDKQLALPGFIAQYLHQRQQYHRASIVKERLQASQPGHSTAMQPAQVAQW